MAKLHKKHVGDIDIAAVYAESLMVLKPWAMWTRDPVSGNVTPATEGTLVAKDVLERVRFSSVASYIEAFYQTLYVIRSRKIGFITLAYWNMGVEIHILFPVNKPASPIEIAVPSHTQPSLQTGDLDPPPLLHTVGVKSNMW